LGPEGSVDGGVVGAVSFAGVGEGAGLADVFAEGPWAQFAEVAEGADTGLVGLDAVAGAARRRAPLSVPVLREGVQIPQIQFSQS
jgi:hypothetical protein